MNAGKDKNKAIGQAKANAALSGEPWIVWFTDSVYWTERLDTQTFPFEWLALPNGLVETSEEIRMQDVLYAKDSYASVTLDFWLRKKLSSYQMETVKQDFERDERILLVEFLPKEQVLKSLAQIPCRHIRLSCRVAGDDTQQSVFLSFKSILELSLRHLHETG